MYVWGAWMFVLFLAHNGQRFDLRVSAFNYLHLRFKRLLEQTKSDHIVLTLMLLQFHQSIDAVGYQLKRLRYLVCWWMRVRRRKGLQISSWLKEKKKLKYPPARLIAINFNVWWPYYVPNIEPDLQCLCSSVNWLFELSECKLLRTKR